MCLLADWTEVITYEYSLVFLGLVGWVLSLQHWLAMFCGIPSTQCLSKCVQVSCFDPLPRPGKPWRWERKLRRKSLRGRRINKRRSCDSWHRRPVRKGRASDATVRASHWPGCHSSLTPPPFVHLQMRMPRRGRTSVGIAHESGNVTATWPEQPRTKGRRPSVDLSALTVTSNHHLGLIPFLFSQVEDTEGARPWHQWKDRSGDAQCQGWRRRRHAVWPTPV